MRLDKWLWAARFFKTRSLAQAAVAAGRVKLGGERIKAAHTVKTGDSLVIRIAEFEWSIVVRGFKMIDEAKFNQISADTFLDWRSKGGAWSSAVA